MEYTITLTSKCNMKCNYCYQGLDKANKNMDKKTLQETIDFIFKDNKEKISITFMGGEPLLEKELIIYAVNYIRENYPENVVKYSLTTNCTLLDDEMIELFKKYDFEIRASIDGQETTHLINRIGRYEYKNILGNLLKMKEAGVRCGVRMTVTDNNCQFLMDNIKFFYENDLRDICVGINYFENNSDEFIKKFKLQLEKIEEFYLEKNKNEERLCLDIVDGKFIDIFYNDQKGFAMCQAGESHLVIDPKGDIYPCTFVSNDKEFNIGNINEGVNKKRRNISISNHIENNENKCDQCEISVVCHGMKCAFLNVKCSGFLNVPNNIMCELEKSLYEMNRRIIVKMLKNKNPKTEKYIKFADENGYDLNILKENLSIKI
ncbi:MAG: radical SAM protein [Bacilli bacterium]|nr:radical SAM protein [Bacilli bacterium]